MICRRNILWKRPVYRSVLLRGGIITQSYKDIDDIRAGNTLILGLKLILFEHKVGLYMLNVSKASYFHRLISS